MKAKLFIVLLALILLTGCTQALQVIDRGADIDIQTMQAGRITNPKYIEAWPYFTGIFKGALGPDRERVLPIPVIIAWDELDVMAARYAAGEILTDEEMGYFFTTKFTRVLTPTVLATLEARVPPVVWTWLKSLIGL